MAHQFSKKEPADLGGIFCFRGILKLLQQTRAQGRLPFDKSLLGVSSGRLRQAANPP